MATTGPCSRGNGGVFLSLCSMMSNARHTFLPSNFTSIENMTNSALPLILFDATPPPALPASSPVLMLKFESLTHTGLPSHFTVVVPLAVSDDFAMFGYGIGIGPAGDGVLHTSGKAIVTPPLSAWTTDKKLTPTVTAMTTSVLGQLMLTVPPRILFACSARLITVTPRMITLPSRRITSELLPHVRRISSDASRFTCRLSS